MFDYCGHDGAGRRAIPGALSFSGRCFQPSSGHMTTWRSWRFRRETRVRSQGS